MPGVEGFGELQEALGYLRELRREEPRELEYCLEMARLARQLEDWDVALEALDKDRDFLLAGGVFSNDAIDAYIELKMDEVNRLRMSTHPVEFDMYYSL